MKAFLILLTSTLSFTAARARQAAGLFSRAAASLLIRSSENLIGAAAALATFAGAECRSWQGLRLHAGEPLMPDTDGDLPTGMYLLQVKAAGFRKTIGPVH